MKKINFKFSAVRTMLLVAFMAVMTLVSCRPDVPVPELRVDAPSEIAFNADGTGDHTFLAVYTNQESWGYSLSPADGGGWLGATVVGDLLRLTAEPNSNPQGRGPVKITFTAGEAAPVTIEARQLGSDTYLIVTPDDINIDMRTNVKAITVESSSTWSVNVTGTDVSWCTATKSGNTVTVRATTNTATTPRSATVSITAGTLSEQVVVTQGAYDAVTYYADGEVVKLKSASTFGSNLKGVNIIVSGDGYTVDQMQRGSGKYYQDMSAAWQNILSVPPYTDYAQYFNVYMIAAVSNEAGMSCSYPVKNVDTKFSTLWEGAGSTGINCNNTFVEEWVRKITELSTVDIHDLTFIMPINEDQYAGTCIMYFAGFSISMCPVETEPGAFRKLVCHEAGGHGFGQLIDEYIYYSSTIPAGTKQSLQTRKQQYGIYANIDFDANILNTTWAGFSTHPNPAVPSKYDMVDTFEGAYMYRYGIWRPESNSCMNNNVLYYNAPSRWAIVSRVSRIAGLGIDFNTFAANEVIPPNPYPAPPMISADAAFVPLGEPIFIDPDGKQSRLGL